MALFKPIRDYVDTLVHPTAQRDALTASRHRAFIAPRLLGSIVALQVASSGCLALTDAGVRTGSGAYLSSIVDCR